MNKHTTISVNYREFTNWTEDRMILARGNAAAIRRNADDYADPDVLATAYEARAEAMFEAWQFVTVSNYDEADRARLADLLH